LSSRIVEIPDGVSVEVDGLKVRVKGPLGELQKDFSHTMGQIVIRSEGNSVVVEVVGKPRRNKLALVGTIAAHIRNMVTGVSKGFTYRLKIVYAHFPMSVKVKGNYVVIENFIGERSPRYAKIVGNAKVEVKQDDVVVKGIDIEEVGQTAANIENATRVTDRDPRIFLDGIFIYNREVGM